MSKDLNILRENVDKSLKKDEYLYENRCLILLIYKLERILAPETCEKNDDLDSEMAYYTNKINFPSDSKINKGVELLQYLNNENNHKVIKNKILNENEKSAFKMFDHIVGDLIAAVRNGFNIGEVLNSTDQSTLDAVKLFGILLDELKGNQKYSSEKDVAGELKQCLLEYFKAPLHKENKSFEQGREKGRQF